LKEPKGTDRIDTFIFTMNAPHGSVPFVTLQPRRPPIRNSIAATCVETSLPVDRGGAELDSQNQALRFSGEGDGATCIQRRNTQQ
jgi:hypothetical protein